MYKYYSEPFYTEEQIHEMEEKDMSFPFSNKYMKYSGLKRQYIPTEELLLKHGLNLYDFIKEIGDSVSSVINEELEYISDQIYSYISKNSGSNSETLKCLIAKGIRRGITPFRFRMLFEEILWKQARYYLNNDDTGKTTGIDIDSKQYLNKGIMYNEDRHIDPKVKISLMELGLVWAGSYDKQFMGLVTRNDW